MFQILEIQKRAMALTFRQECLAVAHSDEQKTTELFPISELSAVLLSEPAVSISGVLISELSDKHVPLIVCDKRHLPVCIMDALSYSGQEKELLIRKQCDASKPFLKQCWKKLILAKVAGQAAVLMQWRGAADLLPLCSVMKIADTDAVESRAAVDYWKKLALFSKRDRNANDLNRLFNYAYTILYAVFAREIAAVGLFPRFGIHHHNRDNPFCLASDMMEPFRPWIDSILLKCIQEYQIVPEQEISPRVKQIIMKHLYEAKCPSDNKYISIFSACRASVASYKKALMASDHKIFKTIQWKVADHVAYCRF